MAAVEARLATAISIALEATEIRLATAITNAGAAVEARLAASITTTVADALALRELFLDENDFNF